MRSKSMRWAGLCLTAIAAFSTTIGGAAAGPRPFGDAKLLAKVPTPPGFPEGIAVRGGRVYIAGPATFGTIGKGPSQVVAFDLKGGPPLATYPTQGENTLLEHGNSSIAFDGKGRLYVLNTQLGMYRLVLDDNKPAVQQPYSTPFPDLPSCLLSPPGTPCSPTLTDLPPLPNDLAFINNGDAYVTDSFQATIWRVPAGGGAPQVWFQSSRLASAYIGVNAIRVDPSGTRLFVTVTADLLAQSFLFTLPLTSAPGPSDLKDFYHFGPGDLPDGIAFGKSGLLYVSIGTPFVSGVSVLSPDGKEKARLRNPLLSPLFPYDSPANIAFNGSGSILLTNHAFVTGVLNPNQFTIVDVFVDDTASPLVEPLLP